MSTEVTVALIALGGAFVSVLASMFMTRRHLATEIRKLDVQIQIKYATALLERRHAAYPKLYKLLSDLVKELRFGNVTRQYLVDLRAGVEEWDSANSILISKCTENKLYGFRKRLITELLTIDEECFGSKDFRDKLRDQIGELEVALRNELGVYIVEFNDSRITDLTFEEIKQHGSDDTKT